ncbi:MAG: hypothetical protein QOD04_5841 [Pseudonocardiales bacterium]|nr:hypothetical protein [Pseudonocardia sp.]MDT7666285.1 hypothetical protein [Pseudonocardiales bacterium]
MRRLTLWIVSTFAALSILVSYQLSLGDAPDTGQHGDCGSTAAVTTAAITTTATITTATTG